MNFVADGCHVFAGGFSFGVNKVIPVERQLEIHGLGRDTAKAAGIDFIEANHWEDWPLPTPKSCMLFGNPRCTGFSCMTAGYDETAHGAWSKPTVDIHDLCKYGIKNEYPLICWESVQQAMSVGRPLLDYLRDEMFVPNGYRIAHLMINAATFGNAQHRKRYFFMAYKADRNFNINPPDVVPRHTTVGDVILIPELLERDAQPARFTKKTRYSPDSYIWKTEEEERIIKVFPQGVDMNTFARHRLEIVRHYFPKAARQWDRRTSEMPFSMHCLHRLDPEYYCPVISGSAGRFLHPTLDRSITVREAARLMGWPADVVPIGDNPYGQIGKGVCPEVGTWLAQQALHYLNNDWGQDDWESSYDDRRGEWNGTDYTGHEIKPPEKTFDLTRYAPQKPVARKLEDRLAYLSHLGLGLEPSVA